MIVTVLGIDLAKHVFQLHGIDAQGRKVVSRTVSRAKLVEQVVKLSPNLLAFEAGSGAHHFARRFQGLGLAVKMIAPQYVRPFRQGPSKDDQADAAAIVEAALRPSIPTVSVKQLWQQDVQILHRIREDLVTRRTALCNQYRSFLAEFGIAPSQSIAKLVTASKEVLANGETPALPGHFKKWLSRFLEQLTTLEGEIVEVSKDIERFCAQSETCQRLVKIPGVGPLTATAFYAGIGDGAMLKNGRQTAAWLGLTPRRVGSGGKTKDLGISKHGDVYLRTLLIHGGRVLARVARSTPDKSSARIRALVARKPPNVAAVALANRNARLAWRLVAKGEQYDAKRAG